MPKDSWKKQTWWSLPVYTGDVSGVCSALYELGGMVVMHDPSGCNSTYNTHDEIRWVQQESLIFLSGLTQLDAITGNDRKLIDDIIAAARQFHPAFIAIANSPVPWLIGTDFAAVCRTVREETGIMSFYIETNAMHDYTRGAGLAYLELAKLLLSKKEERRAPQGPVRVNILGATPLDFTVMDQISTLRSILLREGFEVVSVWAMGDRLENLKKALSADVNLVLSSVGIYTAKWMEETHSIPYVAGVPVGRFADTLFHALRRAASDRISSIPYLRILDQAYERTGPAEECYAGEPVTMGCAAADKILRGNGAIDLIPLTESYRGLVRENMVMPLGEEQITDQLRQYQGVTADPMLECACSEDCHFTRMPHLALSGRLYLDEIKPLITEETDF